MRVTPRASFGALVAFFLAAAVFYPLLRLFLAGISFSGTGFSFGDPFFRHILQFTFGQAFLSAGLATAFGFAGALLYSETDFLGRNIIWRLSLLCFSLPTILTVLAFFGFWQWAPGFLGWPAILLVHTFCNYPVVLRLVGSALTNLDRSEERVALSLGQNRGAVFFGLTLPKLMPAIRSGFFLVFLYCANSFLIVMMLGGSPRFMLPPSRFWLSGLWVC